MRRRECLTHNTAIVYIHTFICQRHKSLITLIKHRHSHLMTDSCTLCRICVNLNLTFIYYGCELTLNLCVQNLTDVFCTETCCECILADTDTDHVTLSCMHDTLDTVQIGVELTLEYRLEVCLHVLSCYLYHISDALFASYRHLIHIRSDQLDLVILDLACFFCMYQLTAVYSGTVKLYLHIAAADDLAFESRCECYRNVDVCDLDLNVSCLKRSCVEFGNILLNDQALRNTEGLLVCDNREAKCDCSCSTCYDHFIQRCKCINKCRNTFHRVFHQACCISRCDITEDQSRSDCHRYDMDHAGNVFSKRNHTNVCTCLVTKLFTLVNDTAYQRNQDTLCLIALYKIHTLLSGRSCAEDNCHARDISSNKGYAQLTDHCISQMSVARSLIWYSAVHVFQDLDKLCTQSGSDT